jgi:membrane peptidoglycan carboxypeptidase
MIKKINIKIKKIKEKINLMFFLKLAGVFILSGVLLFMLVFVYFAKDLPLPEKFTEKSFTESTKIYDRTGEVILYEIAGDEKRTIVPLNEMPEHLKQAVIALEDNHFYTHHGIDIGGFVRSMLVNIKNRRLSVSGSTISQQLIKNTFFSTERSIKRKVRELILALELDRRYEKDQILDWYLNQIPFGSNIYGVEEASQKYFSKSVRDITLEESAILAAMIKSGTYYSPFGNHVEDLLNRKDFVIRRMVDMGFITEKEKIEYQNIEIKFSKNLESIRAPHFVLYVKDYLVDKYGEDFVEKKGLRVYTTLDNELQESAERIVKEGSEANVGYNANNAAMVVIEPNTGEILSMVGSKDYFGDSFPEGCTSGVNCSFDPQYNVATKLPGRQPGSSFKPFVYVTAFEKGFDGDTTVIDEETNFGNFGGEDYIPQNYDGLFRGEISLRSSLAQSLNIPAVKVLMNLAGLKDSLQTAINMGITTLTNDTSYYGPALVLGGGEVRLIDMVSAYGVFANEGLKVPFFSVLRIEDSEGNLIENNSKSPKRVLSIDSSKMITDILSDNEARSPMFGFNSALHIPNHKVSVKTGTTNSYKDAWTVGYTKDIVCGVWVGNNDNTPMASKPSVTLAGRMWNMFMTEFLNR